MWKLSGTNETFETGADASIANFSARSKKVRERERIRKRKRERESEREEVKDKRKRRNGLGSIFGKIDAEISCQVSSTNSFEEFTFYKPQCYKRFFFSWAFKNEFLKIHT